MCVIVLEKSCLPVVFQWYHPRRGVVRGCDDKTFLGHLPISVLERKCPSLNIIFQYPWAYTHSLSATLLGIYFMSNQPEILLGLVTRSFFRSHVNLRVGGLSAQPSQQKSRLGS